MSSDTLTSHTRTSGDATASLRRRLLVVAYYFPPMGMSGVQRVARFVKYLPGYGWDPVVLTVAPAGYFAYDASLMREVENGGVRVIRTASVDPTRLFHRGKTVALPDETRRKALAAISQIVFIPDNKIGWFVSAYRQGKRELRASCYDAIFSSAPPYTAHLVGNALSKNTGIPLVTDFRDDWVGNPRHWYPTPMHRAINLRLETVVLSQSAGVLAINEPIREALIDRHPDLDLTQKIHLLTHGFDPDDFLGPSAAHDLSKMRLLYSGVFYDAQRPDFFLKGLAAWLARRPDVRRNVEAFFVGMVPEYTYRLVKELELEEEVKFAGYVAHDTAVGYLKSADVLWMTVGKRVGAAGISTSKLYEYFGSGKPVLGIVPPGAASQALARYGASFVVDSEDIPGITNQLDTLYEKWSGGNLPHPDPAWVSQFNRKTLAGDLAMILNNVVETNTVQREREGKRR